MKHHYFQDGSKGKRLTVSMTEKEACKIYDDLVGRNSFESHKLRQAIFDFMRSEDVFIGSDKVNKKDEQ